MNRTLDRLSQWVFVLASGLYFGTVFLRSVLTYQDDPALMQVLALQLLFLALYLSEPAVERRFPIYFPIYLVFQTALVFLLLSMPGEEDFHAALLALVSMQVMLHFSPRLGAAWIAFCALGMGAIFYKLYGLFPAIAFSLIYTAGNVFLGSYMLATRRAQAARLRNQALADELQDANRQLQAYSTQLEQLAIARERNRLARELHDSVTQTVFSMTLVTQAAGLLLEREPNKVAAHLERLNQLSRSALAEMQVLIAQLGPENATREGLEAKLRRHLASSRLPQDLSVSLDVQGNQPLEAEEEQCLYRIAEEALNNIVKHSRASQAHIRLHLAEPFWVEITDEGLGFDLAQARGSGRVGLASMRERAAEIGWNLQISSSPGAGTQIRVEKAPVREGAG